MIVEVSPTVVEQKMDIVPRHSIVDGKDVTEHLVNPDNPTPASMKIELHITYNRDEHEYIKTFMEALHALLQRKEETNGTQDPG